MNLASSCQISSLAVVVWHTLRVLYSMSGLRQLANTLMGVLGPDPARLEKLEARDEREIGSGENRLNISGLKLQLREDSDVLESDDPQELGTVRVELREAVSGLLPHFLCSLMDELWQCFNMFVSFCIESLW